MENADLPAQVSRFFDRFVAAFASFDGAEVAHLYHVPYVALRGDDAGNTRIDCVTSRQAVADFFQGALDGYYAQGCRRCAYDELDVVPLGGRSAVGTVTWSLLDAEGAPRRRWRQSYNLVPHDGHLVVLTSTDHLDS